MIEKALLKANKEKRPIKYIAFASSLVIRGHIFDLIQTIENDSTTKSGATYISNDLGEVERLANQNGCYQIVEYQNDQKEPIIKPISVIDYQAYVKDCFSEISIASLDERLEYIFTNIDIDELDLEPSKIDLESSGKTTLENILILLEKKFRYTPIGHENTIYLISLEHIENSSDVIRNKLLRLAEYNQFDSGLINYITTKVKFVSALNDRNVLSSVDNNIKIAIEEKMQFIDKCYLITESYQRLIIENVVNVPLFSNKIYGDLILTTSNFNMYYDEIIFVKNIIQVAMAPIGIMIGYTYTYEALGDKKIALTLEKVISESLKIFKYSKEYELYFNKYLNRLTLYYLDIQLSQFAKNLTQRFRHYLIKILYDYYSEYDSLPQGILYLFANLFVFFKEYDKYHLYKENSSDLDLWRQAIGSAKTTEEYVDLVLKCQLFEQYNLHSIPNLVDQLIQYINKNISNSNTGEFVLND